MKNLKEEMYVHQRKTISPPPSSAATKRQIRLDQLWKELPESKRKELGQILGLLLSKRLLPAGKEEADEQA